MRLILTEKPSVARDIARVLGITGRRDGFIEGDGVRITWCIGHLLELQEPSHYDAAWKRWAFDSLPMLPSQFELRPRQTAQDQWRVVKRLLSDRAIGQIVNACDAGREGELIFRYAYQAAGATAPVQRFWASSLTDRAIKTAWGQLRPGPELDALGDAARCRSEADWLVGLNATRAMTCLARKGGGGGLLSVGRVQTPTLALIVRRDLEIESFVPEDFWTVDAVFSATVDGATATWKGRFFQPGQPTDDDERQPAPKGERLSTEADAEAVAAAASGAVGAVEKADRKKRTEKPPLLYDLTSLQRRANQRYGLSAQQTLDIAQALYEKHKLLSYPRTDARFLTEDQVPELSKILGALEAVGPYQPFASALLAKPIAPGKRVVNAAEVGDHHAILPTTRKAAGVRLSADEKRVYDLVARRLMAALSEPAIFALTKLVVAVPPTGPIPDGLAEPLRFHSKGRVCLERGWQAVDPPKSKKDLDLPRVEVGDEGAVEEATANAGQTRPPRRFDDALLLRAMETAGKHLDDKELVRAMRNAGLGTPATRAAVLQTLLHRKFLVRKAKELWATEAGRALILAIPLDELTSAELTASWEARLARIAEGQEARDAFMRDVAEHVGRIVRAIEGAQPPPAELFAAPAPEGKPLGECPVCGKPVRENRAVFACDAGRACAFVVFKTMSKRKISGRMVKQMLKEGRSAFVKGFRSKAGNEFEAALEFNVDEGRVRFVFAPRESPRGGDPAPRDVARSSRVSPVGMSCPRCGVGHIVAGRAAWGCDQWRDGCRVVLPFEEDGRRITGEEAVRRLKQR
ncbi:MAG: DNA topoisomerase 3 [Proteobacteria bacterium]|nr:DNA topoisomerase 3 [Pseudomonadota bacterium]